MWLIKVKVVILTDSTNSKALKYCQHTHFSTHPNSRTGLKIVIWYHIFVSQLFVYNNFLVTIKPTQLPTNTMALEKVQVYLIPFQLLGPLKQ